MGWASSSASAFDFLAALTLLAGLAKAGLAADPTAGQLLGYKPAQKVEVTVPAAADASASAPLNWRSSKHCPTASSRLRG